MKKLTCLITILLFCGLSLISAQTEQQVDSLYNIVTVDGNEFVGKILHKNDEVILLQTDKFGDITIKQSQIKRITMVPSTQIKDGQLWFENPQAARYFWAPNGYGLRKGEGYYQNVWVLFNQVSYGVTNHFSFGVGILPMFLFGTDNNPIWFTPKISFPIVKDEWNVGVGTLFATVTGIENSSFGLMYGTTTFGNRDQNISLGIGYGYNANGVGSVPVINISGLARIGARGYILSENYIISSEGETAILAMLGGRHIINRFGIDYGLLLPLYPEIDTFIAIPWLGISVSFGD